MPKKVLFAEGGAVDGLVSLHTEDIEGLGALYEDVIGRVYRYQKNASSTGLTATGVCLKKLGTGSLKGTTQRVLHPSAATGPATCLVSMPAGMPVTGIGASGSSTGAFGWVQVAGPAKISMQQSATAVNQQAGCCVISTNTSTGYWGKAYTQTIDSTNGGVVLLQVAQLSESLATTGAATAASAYVNIRCLY